MLEVIEELFDFPSALPILNLALETRLVAIISIVNNNPMSAAWFGCQFWVQRRIPVTSKQEAGEEMDRAMKDYPMMPVVARVEQLTCKRQ